MKSDSPPFSFWKLVVSILICELTGVLSGLLAGPSMNTWFDSLNKPSWNPPSYLFGPVWVVLYLLMGISLWLVWRSNVPSAKKRMAIVIFGLQLFFNFCWSILFFRIHSPALALADIVIMVVTINITIVLFSFISRPAAWLLIPYLCWVCFATVLNYTIFSLN